MSKKRARFFSLLWLANAIIWAVSGTRYVLRDDLTGAVINFLAALVSVALALAFFKGVKIINF